jgi:ribosomal protein S11
MIRIFVSLMSLTMILFVSPLTSWGGFFDNLAKELGISEAPGGSLDEPTIAKGLKEALSTGTTRAVATVSQRDGYFNNTMIKILMPEKIRTVADFLGRAGFQQQVDDFVLSMNRSAEKAAPKATEYFVSAIKTMTFEDARKILQGGNTSATEYFRQKTGDKIYAAFKPVVVTNMKNVGVANSYKQMMEKFEAIPFASSVGSFDLDHYVTTKAVDGLFIMLGEEEQKIRTDPAARGTELLRKVFGE